MTRGVRRVILMLSCVAAVAGLAAGWHVARLTESDVIAAAADRYVAEDGGARTDCAAVADQVAWITVVCASGTGASAIFQADRLGRVRRLEPADPADAMRAGDEA